MAMNKKELSKLAKEGLVEDHIDLRRQLQPAGIDLTLRDVFLFIQDGRVDFTNKERRIAKVKKLKPDNDDWYFLSPGTYKILINETVSIPKDAIGLSRTRSSLLRNGAYIPTGVWDPGYRGKGETILIVHNPYGIHLKKYSRIIQLVLFKTGETEAYSGYFFNENVGAETKE